MRRTGLTGRNKKDGTYIYIATMQPYTEETMKKIERHHRLRAGKGFRTLEKYTDLSELEIPKNQGILLECISNLVANELYREDGTLNDLKETKEKVLAGVRRLSNSTTRLVIVTNEVNADINGYSEETEKYRECIGMVNQSLAEFADIVTEVVYGIPVCIRKEQKKYEEYKKEYGIVSKLRFPCTAGFRCRAANGQMKINRMQCVFFHGSVR